MAENCRHISPGDFGFHNAIRTPHGLKFIDFEYSGWDDPCKTVVDFEWQPKVQLGKKALVLKSAIPKWSEKFEKRYEVLAPVLILKWVCIILRFLDPDRRQAMTIPLSREDLNDLIVERLFTATSYLKKGDQCALSRLYVPPS